MNGRVVCFSAALWGAMGGLVLSPLWSEAKELRFEKKFQKITSVRKNDHALHAEHEIVVRPIDGQPGLWVLELKGWGDYAQFKNVRWLSRAEILEKDGLLFVQTTKTEVFASDVKVFEAYKVFDHTKKSVLLKLMDGKGGVIQEKEYSIEGPICDDVTLVHILPFLTPERNLRNLKYFYLLTNEPKLYHVMVKFRGEDILPENPGVKADQFQLMADLGPLTEVAAKIVPPTFVWYSRDSSDWYMYEGMESGYKTANIRSFPVKQ